MIIGDTSGVLALLDRAADVHESCLRVAANAASPIVLSPFVVAELDYLLTKYAGSATARRFLRDVSNGTWALASFDSTDLDTAADVCDEYADLELGVADASIVVLAHRHRTSQILTLDQRHFRAVKSLRGRSFRLLPFDG